ncbi:MAG: hypothetical protein J6B91_05315 [Prevotella sp.]|nr:hypothetical protein [Prevotella sp.]
MFGDITQNACEALYRRPPATASTDDGREQDEWHSIEQYQEQQGDGDESHNFVYLLDTGHLKLRHKSYTGKFTLPWGKQI